MVKSAPQVGVAFLHFENICLPAHAKANPQLRERFC